MPQGQHCRMSQRSREGILSDKGEFPVCLVKDIALILGDSELEQGIIGQIPAEIHKQFRGRLLLGRKDVLHFRFYETVAAYNRPAVICPGYRRKEGLSSKCCSGDVCVLSCSEEDCNPPSVLKLQKVCMPSALDGMTFPFGVRKNRIVGAFLIRAVDFPASEGADMMARSSSAFCKDEVVPAVSFIDMGSLG